ncbi:hypothetical protein AVEN_263740-1 [Araneus ventricosus]|uniref:Uncharacterized protein n=1 Tax=Araneus ventricosus TaxID=182803 RepID=A0A4Y2ART7_ARAVE|nr:hypothetical protein AVEN_263740-1 [Araneus ventricosus]
MLGVNGLKPRWPSGKVSEPKAHGSKLDSNEDPSCIGLHTNSYVGGQTSPLWCGSLEKGVPAQASSSDRGSKLRGPSQNSPRVASKWDVNMAKLNLE